MDTAAHRSTQAIFKRHIALPSDHGSWVFILSPLLIGLFAGEHWSISSVFLVAAAMAAFLIRQPVTIAIKAYSGRRARRDLPAAWVWIATYGLVGLAALLGLVLQGFAYLSILAIPAVPVFAWHLYLVSKRAERRQAGIEIVGSGVLALAAPAAMWVGAGHPDPNGWWLFGLVWLQSAASIVYAYARLEQRSLETQPDISTSWRISRRALFYTTYNMALVLSLAMFDLLPTLLLLPYAVQWLETIWGTLRPAVGYTPTRIGMRQLIVSSVFTISFILAWNL